MKRSDWLLALAVVLLAVGFVLITRTGIATALVAVLWALWGATAAVSALTISERVRARRDR